MHQTAQATLLKESPNHNTGAAILNPLQEMGILLYRRNNTLLNRPDAITDATSKQPNEKSVAGGTAAGENEKTASRESESSENLAIKTHERTLPTDTTEPNPSDTRTPE